MLVPPFAPAPSPPPDDSGAVRALAPVLGRALANATEVVKRSKTVWSESPLNALPYFPDGDVIGEIQGLLSNLRTELTASLSGFTAAEKASAFASYFTEVILAPGRTPTLGEVLFLDRCIGGGRLPEPLNQVFAARAIDAALATFSEVRSACILLRLAITQPDHPAGAQQLADRFLARALEERSAREISMVMHGLEAHSTSWAWGMVARSAANPELTPKVASAARRELQCGSPQEVHILLRCFGGLIRVQDSSFTAAVDSAINARTQTLRSATGPANVLADIEAVRQLMMLRDWRHDLSGKIAREVAEGIGTQFGKWWKSVRGSGPAKTIRFQTMNLVVPAEQILMFCEKHAGRAALRAGLQTLLKDFPSMRIGIVTMEALARVSRIVGEPEAFKEFFARQNKRDDKRNVRLGVGDSEFDSGPDRELAWRTTVHWASLIAPQPLTIIGLDATLKETYRVAKHEREQAKESVRWFFAHRTCLEVFKQTTTIKSSSSLDLVPVFKKLVQGLRDSFPPEYGRGFLKSLESLIENIDTRRGFASLAHALRMEMYGGAWGFFDPRLVSEVACRVEDQAEPPAPYHANPERLQAESAVRRAYFLRAIGAPQEALALVSPVNDALFDHGTRIGWREDLALELELVLHDELGSPRTAAARLQQLLECQRLAQHCILPVRDWMTCAIGYLGIPRSTRGLGPSGLTDPDPVAARAALDVARRHRETMTDGEQLDRLDQQYPFTATEMALLDAAVLAIASPPETSAANFSKSWETFAPVPGEVTPRQVLRLVQLTKDIHSQLIRLGRFTAVKDLSAAVAQAVPKAARSLPQNPRLLARLCHLQFELYLAGADAALRCDDSSARESLLRAAKNQAVGLQIVAQDDALMKRLPSGS